MLNTDTHKRLPPWLKRNIGRGNKVDNLKRLLREGSLNTVCEEARCPNLAECFNSGTATFLILGDICTRNCGFCSVKSGPALPVNQAEPHEIAITAKKMGINYLVITSVTRDDLEDGGSSHYAATISEVRKINEEITIEVLVPDFKGDWKAIDTVCGSRPHVYNHNIETVPSLYSKVRPEANYNRSLDIIKYVKKSWPQITTKSGIMLGLGETYEETIETIRNLYKAGCDFITIGQYMRPSKKNLPVAEYLSPEYFFELGKVAEDMGFKGVYSGPLVRSSYNAEHLEKRINRGRVLPN